MEILQPCYEDVEMIITKEARRRTSPKSVKLHQERTVKLTAHCPKEERLPRKFADQSLMRTWMKLLIPSAKRVISATPKLAPAPLAPWFPAKGARVANEGRSSHMERRKAGSEISRSTWLA